MGRRRRKTNNCLIFREYSCQTFSSKRVNVLVGKMLFFLTHCFCKVVSIDYKDILIRLDDNNNNILIYNYFSYFIIVIIIIFIVELYVSENENLVLRTIRCLWLLGIIKYRPVFFHRRRNSWESNLKPIFVFCDWKTLNNENTLLQKGTRCKSKP